MMKKACVLFAPGCEETEAVTIVDVLRRGGVNVVTAGLQEGVFEASRGVKLEADISLDKLAGAKEFDILILPGGIPGTEALRNDSRVRDLLLYYLQTEGKKVGCICAAALVLDAHELLEGKRFTCYPALAGDVEGGTWVDERVVVDGNLTTSQGPGTAMAFALELVKQLVDEETRDQVAEGLLYQ
jgi:4-methyl-5(b-hydroxyethyl)-thiazole monophosphate biosynthesis